MPRIHLLSDHLISQIAAGEVVERPASVVKELVENSLDAGAGSVRIELEAGGKRRILVEDDGGGLGTDDALLAFDRHATSKIGSFEDLERVATLGFRGEALASIAAVARVEMLTAEASGEAYRVRIEGGRVRVAEPAARGRGTTLEVASLFFNVPARRKFLKTPATELRRSVEVVQGYALARPDVRFVVTSDGRSVLDAPPVAAGPEGLRQRIGQVFGSALANRLVPLEDSFPALEDESGERIHGFVGTPETTQGRRLFVFVNRRLLRDRSVLATFYRAVRDEWRSDQYPALFLFLDLPPEDVDVNVHPQKAEVRFRDPGTVRGLGDVLRSGLARARGEVPAPLRSPADGPRAPLAWQGLGERSRDGAGEERSWLPTVGAVVGEEVAEAPSPLYGTGGGGAPGRPPSTRSDDAASQAARLAAVAFPPVERAAVPLSGRSGETRPFRLLGQYKGTLILLEGPDGLYLVDQHVAHERILYERLRVDLAADRTPSQALLTPMLLELAPAESLRLQELAPALGECGYRIEPLSGHTLAVTEIPAALRQEEAEKVLLELAADRGEADPEAEGGVEGLRQRLLEGLAASLSCRNAVKMHHVLGAEQMESLVAELFRAEQPYACPHGRPIVLQMTDADLERRFGRRK
ncbi:MAG: DNA mismatch repair endonuclease MutL [Acidobacteria bacterium]|nr:DNA mismatch repair endonuclease MutL [Acidobacteriota bacterium]